MQTLSANYWQQRYQNHTTGWDLGEISTPLKAYFSQLKNKDLKILIPGSGNAHEAEYLHKNGFKNTYVNDITQLALTNFKNRVPSFPDAQLLHQDFFEISATFDLIIEQTFFCALDPSLRGKYAQKCHEFLNRGGKLVGVLFNFPLKQTEPPFGGSKEEYLRYFLPYFDIKEMAPCYNSNSSRENKELFVILSKKD